jgi:hypothetical protein
MIMRTGEIFKKIRSERDAAAMIEVRTSDTEPVLKKL